eukprot:2531678-Prymnesium_polylepis.1
MRGVATGRPSRRRPQSCRARPRRSSPRRRQTRRGWVRALQLRCSWPRVETCRPPSRARCRRRLAAGPVAPRAPSAPQS